MSGTINRQKIMQVTATTTACAKIKWIHSVRWVLAIIELADLSNVLQCREQWNVIVIRTGFNGILSRLYMKRSTQTVYAND